MYVARILLYYGLTNNSDGFLARNIGIARHAAHSVTNDRHEGDA